MLIELPEQVQDAIYQNFLYDEYLLSFKDYFKIPREIDAPIHDMRYTNYYDWEDQEYRSFMMHLLTHLEPRHEVGNTILLEELEEVNEVIFFSQGIVEYGYDLNKNRRFVLRQSK